MAGDVQKDDSYLLKKMMVLRYKQEVRRYNDQNTINKKI